MTQVEWQARQQELNAHARNLLDSMKDTREMNEPTPAAHNLTYPSQTNPGQFFFFDTDGVPRYYDDESECEAAALLIWEPHL